MFEQFIERKSTDEHNIIKNLEKRQERDISLDEMLLGSSPNDVDAELERNSDIEACRTMFSKQFKIIF